MPVMHKQAEKIELDSYTLCNILGYSFTSEPKDVTCKRCLRIMRNRKKLGMAVKKLLNNTPATRSDKVAILQDALNELQGGKE